MSLSKLKLPMTLIEVPGSEEGFAVRGISMNDIQVLLNNHRDLLEVLYKQATKSGIPDQDKAEPILRELVVTAPALAANVIACAAGEGDEPDAVATAGRLPISTQVEALEAIMYLTFAREGGLGNFIQTLTRALSAVNLGIDTLKK